MVIVDDYVGYFVVIGGEYFFGFCGVDEVDWEV